LNRFKAFITSHPQLTAWVVLAVGMVIILLWSAKDVGLLPGQMAALIVATVLVAGLCVWIIGWDVREGSTEAHPEGPQSNEDEEAEQAQQ